jgi:hypothetical protein
VARAQGDVARAAALFDEALGLYRERGDRQGVATELRNLGGVARTRGDDARAAALFEESLALCQEMGNRLGIATTLEGIAGVAAGQRRSERVARLLGAAAALRATLGASPSPSDQAEQAATSAEVRAALGDDIFDAAWEAGRGLALEAAIAEALATADEIAAEASQSA